jgi:hypothetical protein
MVMIPLVYRPVVRAVTVGTNLRKALVDRLWPKENYSTPVEIDQTWVGYFQGLKDAGLSEAELVIEALKVYEKLQFTLEQS